MSLFIYFIASVVALKETPQFLRGNCKEVRREKTSKKSNKGCQNRPSARELSRDLMNGVKLSLYQSDITDEIVDAIVNGANEWLQYGGGVAAAILRKGGRQIDDESRGIVAQRNGRRLSIGDAVYTKAGTLSCKYVILTACPRWDRFDEDRCLSLLHRACIESLCLAAQLELCSIALPPISSGTFGMPKDLCAQVMFKALEEFSSSVEAEFSTLRDIRIVIIDEETIEVFHEEFFKHYTSQVTTKTSAQRTERKPHSSSHISSNVNKLPLSSEKRSEDSHEGHFNENYVARSPQGDQPSTGSNNPLDQIWKSFESSAGDNKIPAPKSSRETNRTTKSKPSIGRGRAILSIRFPAIPSEEGEPKAEADTRMNIEHDTNVGNVKIGKGITCDNTNVFPPGLVVTEEGKRLAKKHSTDAVSDDSYTNQSIRRQFRQEKLLLGNQPLGYMTWRTESRKSLPGYEGCGTIVLTFNFQGGIQDPEHPNPGERFGEFLCAAYLPDNVTGKEVCNLLVRAFNGCLIFTIGKCPATSEDNKIVRNGIELKTGRAGGPACCGYPDPSYLERVKKQLADKGITLLHH